MRMTTMNKDSGFDEVLKAQLEGITELKSQMEILQEDNNRLRENLINSQRETEKALNEIKINEIKEASLRNRVATEFGIKLHEKDN